jgi:hypothetical protein
MEKCRRYLGVESRRGAEAEDRPISYEHCIQRRDVAFCATMAFEVSAIPMESHVLAMID